MQLTITNSRYLSQQSANFLVGISTALTAISYSIQAIKFESQSSTWPIQFSVISLTLMFAAIAAHKLFEITYLYVVTQLFIFTSPIWIGDQATKPWMSIGLITVNLCLAMAALWRTKFALIPILIIEIASVFITRSEYPSITDIADLSLGNNYFAVIWNFGMVLAFIYGRDNYYKICDSIDNEIRDKYQSLIFQFKKLSRMNQKDWRNIRLHGTILNTLISARNYGKNQKIDFLQELKRNIQEIYEEKKESNLVELLRDLCSRPEFANLSIEITGVAKKISGQQYLIVEICREILLNSVKHSKVQKISIFVNPIESDKEIVNIQTLEDLPDEEKAKSSRSLSRLLSGLDYGVKITRNDDGLLYIIEDNKLDSASLSTVEVQELRNTGVINFAYDVLKINSLLGVLTAIGLFFIPIGISAQIQLMIQSLIFCFLIFKRNPNQIIVNFASILSALIYGSLFFGIQDCGESSYLPWAFQISALAFSVSALQSKSLLGKILPLLVFFLESLLLPMLLPTSCQNLLLGSTPGILLIPALVYGYQKFRSRALKNDAENMLGIFNNEKELQEINEYLDNEFNDLIKDCENLILKIDQAELGDNERIEIEILIQKIRIYLLCSEQFESQIIQILYKFCRGRLEQNIQTRIQILGENFKSGTLVSDFKLLISEIERLTNGIPLQLTLSNIPNNYLQLDLITPNPNLQEQLEKLSASRNEFELIVANS